MLYVLCSKNNFPPNQRVIRGEASLLILCVSLIIQHTRRKPTEPYWYEDDADAKLAYSDGQALMFS